MTILDFDHLTTGERIDLIGALWDSIDQEASPLTAAQITEINRRFAALGDDCDHRTSAPALVARLRQRYCA